ncbi:hypothetical protein FQR65_LT20742 [Abscondita terminalis]|nr:hypothetical protein FQR65_LT20742 [Abscondita terminalis]
MQQSPMDDPDILSKYTRDVTKQAQNGKLDPIIGRDEEIQSVVRVLSRKTKNNPVLLGEPGVGKTAIVEGIAQRIIKGDVPAVLKDKKILSLDIGTLMAGAKFVGEHEERVKAITNAVAKTNGEIILFIDEIHQIVGAGNSQGNTSNDVANLLKPALARGEIKTIGATTLDEYRKFIEKDGALERRFQKVFVSEPTVEETISILRGLKERYETYHGVRIHDNAIVAAASLSNRYIADRFLPDKAIDLIDEASATIKTELSSVPAELDQLNRKIMQLEIEKSALSKETDSKSKNRLEEAMQELNKLKESQKIIQTKLDAEKSNLNKINSFKETSESLKRELDIAQSQGNFKRAGEIQYSLLPAIEKQLKPLLEQENGKDKLLAEEVTEKQIAEIIGQDHAIKVVSEAILRSRSGIKNPNKPIGSFIFLGPTGVGKTQVAKSLSRILFDTDKKLIRFDMTEYMEKNSVNKLIGSPPGYVGFEDGGILTEKVRRNPYSIILFDEIEKAHPDVFNLFLQILDDGILTDSKGKTVDFKNTIIIMTTNMAGELILDKPEEMIDDEVLVRELGKMFRPEFINRIDNIVKFNPLSKENIKTIIEIDLQNFTNRVLNEKNVYLKFSSQVINKISEEGYQKEFGARPIKRYIEKNIETLVAFALIREELNQEHHYVIDLQNDKFVIANSKKLN